MGGESAHFTSASVEWDKSESLRSLRKILGSLDRDEMEQLAECATPEQWSAVYRILGGDQSRAGPF